MRMGVPRSLHHLVRWHDTPVVGCVGILRPYLRDLRLISVPGARFVVAQLFVHAIELREQLGYQPVGTAMIGEEIVANAMAAGAPQQLVTVQAEIVAGALQM